MVCLPKEEGGLGVINIEKQDEALLLKNRQKFFNRHDTPWAQLVWEKYYKNGKLPSHVKKGLLVESQPKKTFQFQGNYNGRGTTWKQHFILIGQLEHPKPKNDLTELYSFAKNKLITVHKSTKP